MSNAPCPRRVTLLVDDPYETQTQIDPTQTLEWFQKLLTRPFGRVIVVRTRGVRA